MLGSPLVVRRSTALAGSAWLLASSLLVAVTIIGGPQHLLVVLLAWLVFALAAAGAATLEHLVDRLLDERENGD